MVSKSADEIIALYNKGEKNFCELKLNNITLVNNDLSGADFSGSDMSKSILYGVQFNKCNFTDAKLTECNLIKSSFIEANLTRADFGPSSLRSVDFYLANLQETDLTKCDLSESCFVQTTFDNTKLFGASFKDALFSFTVIRNTLLVGVSFEGAKHAAPSIIDSDTLTNTATLCKMFPLTAKTDSEKQAAKYITSLLPSLKMFLVSAGVKRDELAILQPWLPEPEPEFASVFISYSTVDENFAKKLDQRLRFYGVDVWFAPHNIRGGARIHDQITNAIKIKDKIIIILSDSSMQSDWVITEIREAMDRETSDGTRKLYPIRIVDFDKVKKWKLFDSDSGIDLAKKVREYYVPDFTNWSTSPHLTDEFSRLLEDLRRG